MKLITWLLIGLAFAGVIWYAPKYLAYAEQPVKSDVIVLFIGPDFDARKKEALKLMEEGYAHHLLIPAYGQTFDAHSVFLINTSSHLLSPITHNPSYFEGTHIEMLKAKKMMDKIRFNSVIFVSSPFHMRRVKIITAYVSIYR